LGERQPSGGRLTEAIIRRARAATLGEGARIDAVEDRGPQPFVLDVPTSTLMAGFVMGSACRP
jgi:hypothetical protein